MTHEFYCKDAGAVSCRGHIKADDEETFKTKLVDHLAAKHGVTEPNDTLVDFLLGQAKTGARGEKELRF